MRALTTAAMLLVMLGVTASFIGCGEEGEKGVNVGGAVEDPAIEAANRAASEAPIERPQGRTR